MFLYNSIIKVEQWKYNWYGFSFNLRREMMLMLKKGKQTFQISFSFESPIQSTVRNRGSTLSMISCSADLSIFPPENMPMIFICRFVTMVVG